MRQTIAEFIRSQPIKLFTKNEILLQQGEIPTSIFAVRSGLVKISDISIEGFEQMLWLAKKYDVIPLEWLFDASTVSPFFYTAHVDTEVFVVPKDEFLYHIKDDGEAKSEINLAISMKQRQLLEHISSTLKPKARDKITHMLYHIGLRFQESDDGDDSSLPLTHQNVANLVGITRETASLELRVLKQEGFIDYGKQNITIHTNKLAEIVDTI
ncbi:MAG: Crp/Fnr family transcriptional regulator [Candidatus Saccharimonadales bacterium]